VFQFNQKSLARVLVAVPLKTIVKIRFKTGIAVVLRKTIENQESNYKEFRQGSTRFSFSALGNVDRKTGNPGELCETSSSGAGNHPEAIGKIRFMAGRREQISRSRWSQKDQ
jgi:hypothetical protein